jgi:hypothetical protein
MVDVRRRFSVALCRSRTKLGEETDVIAKYKFDITSDQLWPTCLLTYQVLRMYVSFTFPIVHIFARKSSENQKSSNSSYIYKKRALGPICHIAIYCTSLHHLPKPETLEESTSSTSRILGVHRRADRGPSRGRDGPNHGRGPNCGHSLGLVGYCRWLGRPEQQWNRRRRQSGLP